MFRNLRFFRVLSPWPESETELAELLDNYSFVPCGPYSERSAGWEPPTGASDSSLCRRVSGADLLQLRVQSRLLPVAAIKEALVERIDDFRSRMQQNPSRREVRRLRDETRDELLPRSLVKSERIRGFFLLSESLLCIDAGSDAKAERFLDLLRASLQNLEFVPLTFNRLPGELLTALFLGDTVQGFIPGRECRMQDLSDKQAVVTWKNVDLDDASIRQHIAENMKLTHLAIEFESVLSCVVSETGVLSKLRLPAADAGELTDDADEIAQLDAEFVLLSGSVRRLIERLRELLEGYASQREVQANAA